MIDVEASGRISEKDFIKRNSAIGEGIEIHNMTTVIISYNEERNVVQYQALHLPWELCLENWKTWIAQ